MNNRFVNRDRLATAGCYAIAFIVTCTAISGCVSSTSVARDNLAEPVITVLDPASSNEKQLVSGTETIPAPKGRMLPRTRAVGRHIIDSFLLNPIKHPIRTGKDLVLLVEKNLLDLLGTATLNLIGYPTLGMRKASKLTGTDGMDIDQWESQLDRITGTRQTTGNLTLLLDGDEFFPRLITKIDDAHTSIKVRTYIFDNDDYALEIADRLKQRSSDVSVRVTMDSLGTLSGAFTDSLDMPKDPDQPMSIAGYLRNDSEVETRVLSNVLLAGDHTKAIIVDQTTAFVGGMNIGREYRYEWHDMMVELSGPVVDQIDSDFDRLWRQNRFGLGLGESRQRTERQLAHQYRKAEQHSMRLLYTRLHDAQIYRAYLAAIRNARKYIYIENAYFSDDAIRYELIKARLRGVDVRVILPSRGDNGPMDKSNILAANSWLKHGVRVFIYPGMSHIKAAVIDGWACFGSANFDKLSLKINKEMNIATSSKAVVDVLLQRLFYEDFDVSEEIHHKLPIKWSYPLYELMADLML